jgi:hypothetical protein
MKSTQRPAEGEELTETWALSYAATLASSIRVKGIFLEVRARLPLVAKKSLKISSRQITLRMPSDHDAEFRSAAKIVSTVLADSENLPVIPRELEDILAISSTERHRWLKDGRLQSAGTRTVKLRGRAKKVTFHVFDTRFVEDVLDRGVVEHWREEDIATAAENRRRAAWKAKMTRSARHGLEQEAPVSQSDEDPDPGLIGWKEFERDGPLR